MSEPVVSKYDTKENLFLKFWIPSLVNTNFSVKRKLKPAPEVARDFAISKSSLTNFHFKFAFRIPQRFKLNFKAPK